LSAKGRLMKCASILIGLTILATMPNAFAQNLTDHDELKCSQQLAMLADDAASKAKSSWADFYKAFKNYEVCDDGGIAEGFSDSAAQLFAKQWGHIGDFFSLADKDADFELFSIRHIDETDDANDLDRIAVNARDNCPSGREKLCKAIWAEATYPDVGDWLYWNAHKQKSDDGGAVGYYPEHNEYVTGPLDATAIPYLIVAFTLEGQRDGNDWLRYVAVFTPSSDPNNHEHSFCCIYQIGGKGIASEEKMEIRDNEIVISGRAFVPGKDAMCCPSQPMTLRVKLVEGKLVEDSEMKPAKNNKKQT
jgi:hypothetical protein